MIEPCPFCGVDLVRLHYKEADGWPEWVECANCHATGDKRTFKQDAIDSWNRLSRIVRAAEQVTDKYEIFHQKRFSYCPMEEFERAEHEYTDSVIRLGEIVSGMPVEGGWRDGR